MVDRSPQRCAIYTRKSIMYRTDEEYGSIESQRDICSAYIKSQAHRGWRELALRYDDLGQSGGTLERPALARLISDIENGAVDVVVLYKIDRLTRSLRDFMRLLDIFERHDVGFFSITQAFDTKDSLGRLVLNILLTFAQFEREMLADRIRDKHRAMRARGLWTGGRPPMGYRLEQGEMIIDPSEASKVREIFDRFLQVGNYCRLAKELGADGFENKARTFKNGRVLPPTPITSSCIHAMLRNPIYVNGWPTSPNPEKIITPETWAAVQELGAERAKFKVKRDRSPNILLGLLFDSYGRRMTIHEYTVKGERYRYYVSTDERWARTPRTARFRAKADDLEGVVFAFLVNLLSDREQVRALLLNAGVHGLELEKLTAKCPEISKHVETVKSVDRGPIIEALCGKIDLARTELRFVLRPSQVERLLRHTFSKTFKQDSKFGDTNEPTQLLRLEVVLVRAERNFRLPTIEHAEGDRKNPALIALLRDAKEARRMLEEENSSMIEIGKKLHRSYTAVGRLIRLTYLAPDITVAILDGRQPPHLSRKKLFETNFPTDWAMQRKLFGFEAQATPQMSEQRY